MPSASPSLTLDVREKNKESSPSFTIKFLKFLYNQAIGDMANGTSAGRAGADGDDDINVAVGPPSVFISPDQADSSDSIRKRVGWSAVGGAFRSDASSINGEVFNIVKFHDFYVAYLFQLFAND